MLSHLFALVPAPARPAVIAILVIIICYLLFRPRIKPTQVVGDRTRDAGSYSATTTEASARVPALSISTVGTLVEFSDGGPQLIPGAANAVRRIASAADVYFVTQLPEDSDKLEACTLELMANAGLFEE